MSPASSHLIIQATTALGGAALVAVGVFQKDTKSLVAGVSMILGALAGSHVGQFVEKNAAVIQADVSRAEQLLPIVAPLLPVNIQALIKGGEGVLDEVLAAVVTAAAQKAGQYAGQATVASANGGPSQA